MCKKQLHFGNIYLFRYSMCMPKFKLLLNPVFLLLELLKNQKEKYDFQVLSL